MRYLCRVSDRTTDSASLQERNWWPTGTPFTWRFSCQHPGCEAAFPADPSSLDCYLCHLHQGIVEEAKQGVSRRKCHTLALNAEALTQVREQLKVPE